jgi:hypothetical protein
MGHERRRGGLKAGFCKLTLICSWIAIRPIRFSAAGKAVKFDFVTAHICDFAKPV